MVARSQFERLGVPLKSQKRPPPEHHDPLALVLIVPESLGRGVAVGDDPLDATHLVDMAYLGLAGAHDPVEVAVLDDLTDWAPDRLAMFESEEALMDRRDVGDPPFAIDDSHRVVGIGDQVVEDIVKYPELLDLNLKTKLFIRFMILVRRNK